MALKKKPAPKIKPLYTLHEEERLEYVRRQSLMQNKYMEFQAAQLYLNAFQDFLVEAHQLPTKFNLDLKSGDITEREAEDAEDGSV
jgi:hypothetical protein